MLPSRRAALNDELAQLPVSERLTLLAFAIVDDVPAAVAGIAALVHCAGVMAKQLTPGQRAAVSYFMKQEASELGAQWN